MSQSNLCTFLLTFALSIFYHSRRHFFVLSFNIDTDIPIFKLGPPKSRFGFSVAQHFTGSEAWMLIGAPQGESGQRFTRRAGALYQCPINSMSQKPNSRRNEEWCRLTSIDFWEPNAERPEDTTVYYSNKTDQFLGGTISSSGTPDSPVVVCASNAVFDVFAYMDGACYLLNNTLGDSRQIRNCQNLIKKERHNSYGQCQQGFSATLRQDHKMLVTGLPGVKRWLGGLHGQTTGIVGNIVRETLRDDDDETSVENYVTPHSYLGYSVNVGRFGFPYESESKLTIVSGAPRFNESGAVFFLPFSKESDLHDSRRIRLTQDRFLLTGNDVLGSTFGYALEVFDIDNNKYEDLIVSAPNYFDVAAKMFGGAIFVYFASGKATDTKTVFLKPHFITGPLSFGMAVSKIGDINKDGFFDFAVGAPFDQDGGSLHIFLGQKSENFDIKPSQVIYGKNLGFSPLSNLATFGFSISGGTDLDKNGYPDILVGAFASDAAVLLRTRPVIKLNALVDLTLTKPIDREKSDCNKKSYKTCFKVKTMLKLNGTSQVQKFQCSLEVLADGSRGKRAQFDNGKHMKNWTCFLNKNVPNSHDDWDLYILESNRDWLNPIKMRFSAWLPLPKPPRPDSNSALYNIGQYPVLDGKYASKKFQVEFDNKCGPDRECHSDVQLACTFLSLAPYTEANVFLKDVGKDDNIDLVYTIHNGGERAYETMLYVQYDETWVERPQILHANGVKEGSHETGMIEYHVGNPLMDRTMLNFTIRFSIVRDKSGRKMPRDFLTFKTFTNTTSIDTDPENNNCSLKLKVVTKTELSLTGYTTPRNKQLLFGGKITAESDMEFFEDIGPEVQHIYELRNEGPWSVADIFVQVDFPYEVNSEYPHGKWALYITDEPTIMVANPAQSTPVSSKICEYDRPDVVNPLRLKTENNVQMPTDVVRRQKRNTEKTKDDTRKHNYRRIRPKEMKIGAEIVRHVTFECSDDPKNATAKCVRIRCPVKSLQMNGNATITIVSRLWNSTFVEDYRDVQTVEIASRAEIVIPEDNVIEEEDPTNNKAKAVTEANPDLPAITEHAHIPLWIIILAVLGGILLLLVLVLVLWKCGFFRRKLRDRDILYRAEFKHHEEFD